MTYQLITSNRVPGAPKYTVLGDDPDIYQIYIDRGDPTITSTFEEDKNEFFLNLISSLDDVSFAAYIGAYAIIAIGSILDGVIPDKVFVPSGCDWLEYDLDLDLETVSSGTLWVRWEDCNGVRFIPYPNYTSTIPFNIEWPGETGIPENPPEDAPPEASANYFAGKDLLDKMIDETGCDTNILYLTNDSSAPYYMQFDATDSQYVSLQDPVDGPRRVYDGCQIAVAIEDDTSFRGYRQYILIFDSTPPDWWLEARDLDNTTNPPPSGTDDCEVNWNVELFRGNEVVARFGVTIPNLFCSLIVQFGVRIQVGTSVSLGGVTWKTELSNNF
jgi:hypothetical protein